MFTPHRRPSLAISLTPRSEMHRSGGANAGATNPGTCGDCPRCGDMGNARKMFDKMRDIIIVAWKAMICGCEQNGYAKEAIGLFDRMKEMGVEPDSAAFFRCWVHEYVVRNGLDLNVVLGTSLINMYTRCGNVSKAREVFDVMKERNVIAWTVMISGISSRKPITVTNPILSGGFGTEIEEISTY
ncbi:unnamed protein product [Dovyalis caffra]|uniref:Pentatricopeptide repeat-containing protein n=1 Tax=Dovyalis caffra TaxID=77055 RepID=A0AAV1S1F7_9ROSI|nr:unnamed protein product [Dovyalis caffra]